MDSEHPTTELNKTDYTQKGKKGRVIIRNLVWDITQKHLRALFSEFGILVIKSLGQIEDINIPINPTNNKGRGFAFVEFVNRNSALNAIRKLNGTTYKGRQIILDSAVGKDKFATPNTKPEVLEAPEVNEDPATIEE
jgi:RNA recognition motif-containing protein